MVKNKITVKNFKYEILGEELNIFMEYMDQGTIKSKLKKLKEKEMQMSENVARIYTKQILLGLEYMHCIKGVFHRDLKPENVLLNSFEEVKISDFGESKLIQQSEWTLIGTPSYMAPEIINNVILKRKTPKNIIFLLIFGH